MAHRIEHLIRVCILACLLVSTETISVFAQLTILNTPTTDIVNKKDFYL